ncbi:hypothetical protein AA106555_0989 [Neokomagataea thailandica NBRC 106555]|uniref:Uncharacterized protein n=1 Tax=Neokomagataea thailandica NBRC 106555 TaxID=1223520 RepID=A0ABQ0QPP7_9PROT|nr:hypothetical protein AA106555_0989 [Neokomagataea thailandica NBRC 106555]
MYQAVNIGSLINGATIDEYDFDRSVGVCVQCSECRQYFPELIACRNDSAQRGFRAGFECKG